MLTIFSVNKLKSTSTYFYKTSHTLSYSRNNSFLTFNIFRVSGWIVAFAKRATAVRAPRGTVVVTGTAFQIFDIRLTTLEFTSLSITSINALIINHTIVI